MAVLLNPFTSEEIAYGNRCIPKLLDPNNPEVITSLESLVRLLHFPENVFAALDAGIIPKMNILLSAKEQSTQILILTTSCFTHLSSHALSRTHLLPTILNHLTNPLSHSSSQVRLNIYILLSQSCKSGLAVPTVLAANLWETLIKKARIEVPENQPAVLETIYSLLRYSTDKTLPARATKSRTLPILLNLITSQTLDDTKIEALNCIAALCFHAEIKADAVRLGLIPTLISLLTSSNDLILASVCSALMSLTIDVDGKKSFVKEEAIAKLLENKNETVLMNAIQTITHCAEDYRARFQFQRYLEKELEKHSPELAIISQRATSIITWRP